MNNLETVPINDKKKPFAIEELQLGIVMIDQLAGRVDLAGHVDSMFARGKPKIEPHFWPG